MNNEILRSINKSVRYSDELFILGDFAWGRYDETIERFADSIKCQVIHFIFGNHDIAPVNSYLTNFTTASHYKETKINGVLTSLSHYPIAFWDKCHRGSYHLYGHTHSEVEEELDVKFPGRKSMDVGVDNAYKLLGEYRPFSELEIVEFLGNRPGHGEQK